MTPLASRRRRVGGDRPGHDRHDRHDDLIGADDERNQPGGHLDRRHHWHILEHDDRVDRSGDGDDRDDDVKGKGTSVVRMNDPAPLTAELLAPYDIVLLDQLLREYTAPEAQAVQDWVEAGGGLMAMNGYSFDVEVGAKRTR